MTNEPCRTKTHALVGVAVVLNSMDGIPTPYVEMTVVEISSYGLLFRHSAKGTLHFASSASFAVIPEGRDPRNYGV